MANEQHLNIARRGAKTWNAWRMENPSIQPDLSDLKHFYFSLVGFDLSGVNLHGSDLRLANLAGANLTYADLSDANLTKADLTRAQLQGARLVGANLTEANLTKADADEADFSRIRASGVRLLKTHLRRTALVSAHLSRAQMNGADLENADLRETNLTAADLRGAVLVGANLREADLRDARLLGARLEYADLSYARTGSLREAEDLTFNYRWMDRGLSDQVQRVIKHVVQVEALSAYLVILVVLTFLLSAVAGTAPIPIWMSVGLLLVLVKPIIRVTNPTGPVRNRLTWAAVLGGVTGMVVGATTDILTGGLTGGQGTLIGFGGGAAVGGIAGNWIQGWGDNDKLLDRADAFDYLYTQRNKNPKVANAKLIDVALDQHIQSYDKAGDGRKWFAREDLDAYLR